MSETVSSNQRETESIEQETGVFVPHFISDLPRIEPSEAGKLSKKYSLVSDVIIRLHSSKPDWLEKEYAMTGLEFCRRNNITPLQAEKILKEKKEELTVLDLFEKFKNPDQKKITALMAEEQKKREIRDNDILKLEVSLLKKRKIEVPNFSTLLEYCGWVPEVGGHNPQIRKRMAEGENWDGYLHSPADIYWDLQKHYSQIILNCRRSFDPLSDWRAYLKGELDITKIEFWYLQNMGPDDISYYSMSLAWGGGARTRPSREQYSEPLLTHSTNLGTARRAIEEGYLHPRVCYSSGQVVSVEGSCEVCFIFSKDVLTQTYSIESYTEPGGDHENEMRSNELNNINLAIGCVPVSHSLFPDYNGQGEGTSAIGRETIARWGKNYIETGKLWTKKEEKEIRKLVAQVQERGDNNVR